MSYNYSHFKVAHYPYEFEGIKVNHQLPHFSVHNIAGESIAFYDLLRTFTVIETGSLTCNVYIKNIKRMNALKEAYPDVNFLVLYVREAHPGSKIGVHWSIEDKIWNAKKLHQLEHENREIIIDDLDGTAHKLLGEYPNMLYVIDPTGEVIYKDLWASPERTKMILAQISKNKTIVDIDKIRSIREKKQWRHQIYTWNRVLSRAGSRAKWDFIKEIMLVKFNSQMRKNKPR